jgi:hypothetical protein
MCKTIAMRYFGREFVSLAVVLSALAASTGCERNEMLGPVANAGSVKEIRAALTEGSKGDSAATAAVSTGTGWATLRGKFVFDGAPPQRPPYNVTKEPEFCTEGGRPPLQETLIVDSATSGIKNVAVYLRRASRVHESLAASEQPIVFDQKMCMFLPHVVPAVVGRAISIKNSDQTGHNAKFGGFNETIASGAARDYVPQAEVALPQQVSCSIHPWMIAWFLPRANPYVAVTKEDGTFELANLPAGEELEFQAWHETASGAQGSLVPGTPATRELKWTSRGRFKITLQPDEVKEISITVPASAFKAI